MRKVKVYYSDKMFSDRGERFETRVMPVDKAKELVSLLKIMGCTDFEYVPVKEAA